MPFCSRQLSAAGLSCATAFVQSDHPYQALIEAAERLAAT